MKRTLIITAHLDDETFGIGGTLAQLCSKDAGEVFVYSFCSGRDAENSIKRKDAFCEIQTMLGFNYIIGSYFDMTLEQQLLKELTLRVEELIDGFDPKRIITVCENDIHQDHKLVSQAVKIAARPSRKPIDELLEFQIPGTQPFTATYFDTVNDVSDVLSLKQKMFQKYTTENQPNAESKEYFRTIYRKLDI